MNKRDMILLEAEKLFTEKGYYGLSLTELLERCDIPKGSFYYYFPDGKAQLLQQTLRRGYEGMVHDIVHDLLVEPTALACFEKMADELIHGIVAGERFVSLFLTMISIESVHMDACIHQTCKKIYEDWQALYAEHLMRFGFSEEESVIKAQAVFALIHGSMVSSWIKQDPADLVMARKSLRAIIGDR